MEKANFFMYFPLKMEKNTDDVFPGGFCLTARKKYERNRFLDFSLIGKLQAVEYYYILNKK